MSDIVIIGAGKFSLVIASYLGQTEPTAPLRRLAVDGEELAPGLETSAFAGARLDPAHRYVLGVAAIGLRRRLLADGLADRGLDFPNFLHPTAHADPLLSVGRGNIFGPNCYVGVYVAMGSFNVINYHCCIGNHNTVGDNNFFAPQFNSGNSVRVASDCYFGLNVIVTPDSIIHDGVTVQAGATVSEMLPARAHCLSGARQKVVQFTQPS